MFGSIIINVDDVVIENATKTLQIGVPYTFST